MKTSRFKVGDRVRFRMGARRLSAIVVEDRGNLGVNGEQIIRVQHKGRGPGSAMDFELSASEVTR